MTSAPLPSHRAAGPPEEKIEIAGRPWRGGCPELIQNAAPPAIPSRFPAIPRWLPITSPLPSLSPSSPRRLTVWS